MHILILGNGIAGITAARYLRKLSDHKVTVISGETDYFFSRTALMYVYMGHMRFEDTKPYEDWFWTKNRIQLKKGWVNQIDFQSKKVLLEDGTSIGYDKLLLATGSKPNKFGWPGQDLKHVQGLYSYQDLVSMEAASHHLKRAVIVGGGLIGIEMAEMFHARHIPVTLLVREENYWNNILPFEESQMVNRHIQKHGLDLRLQTELKEILDDGTGKVGAVVTNHGERIECGFVGLTTGVSPNIEFLKSTNLEINRGILVNEYLQTNIPDVFAAGDCAELRQPAPHRKSIEAVWYTGRMMGQTAASNICGLSKPYQPGIWFNSAKFLEIEYQVYGQVLAKPPQNHQSLYWEHPKKEKSIRIVYEQATKKVLGFNLMGIRFRQEVCEQWIRKGYLLETVLENLPLANFDPEFFESYEKELLALYQKQTGQKIKLKSKRSLTAVGRFLNSKF